MGDLPTRKRCGVAKVNPAALRMREWHAHVATTPQGFVPQVMHGTIFVYGIAMGTRWTMAAIVEHFENSAPRRYWPDWMQRMAREARQ